MSQDRRVLYLLILICYILWFGCERDRYAVTIHCVDSTLCTRKENKFEYIAGNLDITRKQTGWPIEFIPEMFALYTICDEWDAALMCGLFINVSYIINL